MKARTKGGAGASKESGSPEFNTLWKAFAADAESRPDEALKFYMAVINGDWGEIALARRRLAFAGALTSLRLLKRWREIEPIADECLRHFPGDALSFKLRAKARRRLDSGGPASLGGATTGQRAHNRKSHRIVAVLSNGKTASQSVYRSLRRALRSPQVFHAHSLDLPNPISAAKLAADPEGSADWVRRMTKGAALLRGLVDVRIQKTLVTICREPRSRAHSALFFFYTPLIQPFYDPSSASFPDRAGLEAALVPALDRVLGYPFFKFAFAPLGVPREAVERPFSITQVRPDLEVVSLRFEALQEDFARLAEHLGAPGLELLHENQTRDPRAGEAHGRNGGRGDDRAMYRAFKRDYVITDETIERARLATSSDE